MYHHSYGKCNCMIYKTVSLCKWLYPSCPCLNLLPEARTETHCATFTTASIINGLKYGLNCFFAVASKHLACIMLEKYYVSIQKSKICGKNEKRFSSQLAQKYDPQTEEALRTWIHEVTGRTLPDNFMEGLKDGVILCEWVSPMKDR